MRLFIVILIALLPTSAFAKAQAISDTNIKFGFFKAPTVDNQIKRWRVNPGILSSYGLQAHFSSGPIPAGEIPLFGIVPPDVPGAVNVTNTFPLLPPPPVLPFGDTKFNFPGGVPVGKAWGPIAPTFLVCGALLCGSSDAGGFSGNLLPGGAGVWSADTFAKVDVPLAGFHGYAKVYDPWIFSSFEPDSWLPSTNDGDNILSFSSNLDFLLEIPNTGPEKASTLSSFEALIGDLLLYKITLRLEKDYYHPPVFTYSTYFSENISLLDSNGSQVSSGPSAAIESYLNGIADSSSIAGSLNFDLGYILPSSSNGYPLPIEFSFRHDAAASLEQVPAPIPLFSFIPVLHYARRLKKLSRQLPPLR